MIDNLIVTALVALFRFFLVWLVLSLVATGAFAYLLWRVNR